MRVFLSSLIIIFNLQSWTKADDSIKDFQVEGMSIGESALDYFSKEKIMSGRKVPYEDDSFISMEIDIYGDIYEAVTISYKKNDNNYLLYQLKGIIFIEFNKCIKKKEIVVSDIKKVLENFEEKSYNIDFGESYGKSFAEVTNLYVKNGVVRVWCSKWDKKNKNAQNWKDSLNVDTSTNEFMDWLENAY